MPATVTLRVVRGRLEPGEYEFDTRTTCVLGRAGDCSPRLPDDERHNTVSRHHCLLDINPPAIRIRDFGSLNGTFVNGRKIGQRAAHQTPREGAAAPVPEYDLADGDEIRLGDTVFRVHIHLPANQPTLSVILCAKCHREVSGELTGGYLCADCRADSGDIARHLVDTARAGRRELAPIRGYQLLRELGRGGMGSVYLARHEDTGRLVALKVLLPQAAASSKARARFLREVEFTRALRHPNIAALHDSGFADGVFYFTAEYCAGGSLDQFMLHRGGRLGVPEATRLACQALEGLAYAHDAGVVHRDMSPHNLLLGGAGDAPIAKVGDFGLAKAFDQAGLSGLTRTGTLAGKPGYVSRRQVINFRDVTPAVDLWALASCLYYALTASYPRDFPYGRDPWLVILQTEPMPIRMRDPNIPAALAAIVDEALREDAASDFRTAEELRGALLAELARGGQVSPTVGAPRLVVDDRQG
ncbi:protein kinase [Nocardia sp. NPDC051750]|uniref:protein kinase domain-containing protein n=1 Tax=Nocardia sp. NPDC051750 TaxID=3364325 RepID=UPI0037968609